MWKLDYLLYTWTHVVNWLLFWRSDGNQVKSRMEQWRGGGEMKESFMHIMIEQWVSRFNFSFYRFHSMHGLFKCRIAMRGCVNDATATTQAGCFCFFVLIPWNLISLACAHIEPGPAFYLPKQKKKALIDNETWCTHWLAECLHERNYDCVKAGCYSKVISIKLIFALFFRSFSFSTDSENSSWFYPRNRAVLALVESLLIFRFKL